MSTFKDQIEELRELFPRPEDQQLITHWEQQYDNLYFDEQYAKHPRTQELIRDIQALLKAIKERLQDEDLVENKNLHIALQERKKSYEWFLALFDKDFDSERQLMETNVENKLSET